MTSTLANIEGQLTRFAQSPAVLRSVSRVMREVAPITKIGQAVFVFKYTDVVDALAADTDFGVTPGYAGKMIRTSGAFFLGMEDGQRYQQEHSFTQRGFRTGDDERVRRLVGDTARELVAAKARGGRIDLVKDFAAQIPLVLLRDYFGVPGPAPQILSRWMSSLFWELFLNFANDKQVTQRAEESAREMRPYLLSRAAEIRAKGGEDTFLGRLVAAQQEPGSALDELAVVRNIGGVIIGAMSTQAKSMALAVEELLRRPEVLAEAREAARGDDDEALSGFIFEALRFNPHNPLIVRYAMRPTVVAPGTPHAVSVSTGAQIFAMTISASFDAKGFKNPLEFNPRRAYADYLHFGYGLHRCFGAQLVKVVLTAALKELLKLDDLRSVAAPWRALQYDGPFPSSFPLRFSPPAISGLN